MRTKTGRQASAQGPGQAGLPRAPAFLLVDDEDGRSDHSDVMKVI
jgi:hypothetical protein